MVQVTLLRTLASSP